MDYLTRILNAKVYDVAVETSLDHARVLSARIDNKVLIKREDQQPVHSFKLRGAYNKMAHLPAKQLRAGVVTASSGNHAQGVALSAQKLGVEATIVMPKTTPAIKVDAVRARGAKVELHGESYSDSYEYAQKLVKKATEALSDTQKKVSDAFWNADWAKQYGTDPLQPYLEETDENGKVTRKPNRIDDAKVEEYQQAYVQAQRDLREAERAIVQAQRDLDKAREGEIVGNDVSNEKIVEAERRLNEMINGKGNAEVISAQKAVKAARLGLEEAEVETLNSLLKGVETAQRALEKAQKKVDDGQIVAPQDGEVISISIGQGDTAESGSFVIEIADTSRLEIGAELGGDQMRQLQEGQPAEVTLLSRPDVIMPAFIRQMPEPYGSGSSGTVQSRDRRTLFEITDFKNLELKSGQNVKIRIVLERKEDALWLPPDAVRSFEGRRFVVVRTPEGDRRQTVKVGIETEDKTEILEGVEAGDTIVGQ